MQKPQHNLVDHIKTYNCSLRSSSTLLLRHHRIAVCPKGNENDASFNILIYEEHKEAPTITITAAHQSRIYELYELEHNRLLSYSDGVIKIWSLRKYDYKLLQEIEEKNFYTFYPISNNSIITVEYNDDSRESRLHLRKLDCFEKVEKECEFRGNIKSLHEIKENNIIVIAYSDVQPDDECLRNDGVVLINSLTFQHRI